MYVFVFFSRACCFPMQVNKTLTSLNLWSNELGPEGGKALGKSLEVTFSICRVRRHNALSMTANFSFLFPCTPMQVNTKLTTLNLYGNELGPEGGKAIAKSLEVTPIFIVSALLSL